MVVVCLLIVGSEEFAVRTAGPSTAYPSFSKESMQERLSMFRGSDTICRHIFGTEAKNESDRISCGTACWLELEAVQRWLAFLELYMSSYASVKSRARVSRPMNTSSCASQDSSPPLRWKMLVLV